MGSIFPEMEGLVESRSRLSNHNGPLCGGLAWTSPQAWYLVWGGPCFLICSQTRLPNNPSEAQRPDCEMRPVKLQRNTHRLVASA